MTLMGTGGGTYLWNNGETLPWILVDTAGTYTVIVTDPCNSDTASVTVTMASPITATITGVLDMCVGGSTTLTAMPGGAAFTYAWSTGSTDQGIVVTSAGSYGVTVSDGCTSGTASATVSEYQMDVEASASPGYGEAPLPVDLVASSTPPASTWLWDLGDGSTAASSSVAHDCAEPGIYTVVVTGTDANGCSDSDTLIVEVLDTIPSQIQMPNVFSPDGDGINDAFFVMATNIQAMELTVRADDGHVVFSTNDPHGWWNGIDPGNPSAGPIHGTYKYLLHATTDQGSAVEASRRVVLVTDHYTQCIDASIEPVFGDMFDPRWCMPIYATNDLVCVE